MILSKDPYKNHNIIPNAHAQMGRINPYAGRTIYFQNTAPYIQQKEKNTWKKAPMALHPSAGIFNQYGEFFKSAFGTIMQWLKGGNYISSYYKFINKQLLSNKKVSA